MIAKEKLKKRVEHYCLLATFLLFFCLPLRAQKIELRKIHEFGSEEIKAEMFFQVIDIEIDSAGNIFILDSGDNCIKKFSDNYEYLGEIRKRGQGPGEMMRPLDLEIGTDGNLYLNDLGNRRINIYDSELKYLKSMRLEKLERLSFDSIFVDKDSKIIVLAFPKIAGDKYFYKFSLEGKFLSAFLETFHPSVPKLRSDEEMINFALLVSYFIARANVNHDRGLIAFTHLMPENPYKVYVLNNNGDLLETMSRKIRDFNPEEQRENLLSRAIQTRPSIKEISIYRVHFTKENYVLIQRRHDIFKHGSLVTTDYISDIFSPGGDLIVGDLRTERILAIDNKNNAYMIQEKDDGIVRILVYSLEFK